MKRFFIKSFILFVLVCLLILSSTMVPLPEYAYSFAIVDKHHTLASAKSPKIVLAGGSNLAFGVDSAAIQRTFCVPVVNMGLHAGFGLGRILDDISPFLQMGDILLIIPEYDHFTHLWDGLGEAYQLIFDFRQYRLLWSPYYGLPEGLFGYFSDHHKWWSLFEIISLFQRNNTPKDIPAGIYIRAGFNEYGDYVKHLGMANQDIAPVSITSPVNKSYLKYFFNFIDALTRRGITVVLSYPGFEEQSFHNSATLIQELDMAFRKKENLLVISTPESYCYPVHHFYDSLYHLNMEGRVMRTEQLIRDLQASGLFTQAESY